MIKTFEQVFPHLPRFHQNTHAIGFDQQVDD